MQQLYRFLPADHRSNSGGWGTWRPGVWRTARGRRLQPCVSGLHGLTVERLVGNYMNHELWRLEVDPSTVDRSGRFIVFQQDKLCVMRARITTQVTTWNERTARLFAAVCAERALPIFEQYCPADDRPRRAIETARCFAIDVATHEKLAAASAAARYAASAAASAATWDAERQWQGRHLAEMLGLPWDVDQKDDHDPYNREKETT